MVTISLAVESDVTRFVRESNLIEGIERDPTHSEIEATHTFLLDPELSIKKLEWLQAVYAPGNGLRLKPGMNVMVGGYEAPPGGPSLVLELAGLIARVAERRGNPWRDHVAFEMLHPFMDGNGRTGRALWAWQMGSVRQNPFGLPFLHRFYYQTLGALS